MNVSGMKRLTLLSRLHLSIAILSTLTTVSFGQHGHEGPHSKASSIPTVESRASQHFLRFVGRLSETMDIFDEMKKNGTPFADSTLEDTLRQLAHRFREAIDMDSLLPGTKMGNADLTVWLDNLETLLDYAIEILGLQAADNLTNTAQIRATAADNLEKKWRTYGASKQRAWTIPDASDSRLGPFGIQEARRRGLLVSSGNLAALTHFTADLGRGLRGQSGPAAPSPSSLVSAVDGLKTKSQDAQKLVQDYERLRIAFQKYVEDNIRGKSADQISQDVLKEARRRSAELRDLELSIQRLVGNLPQDLREAIERFHRDPRAFVEQEADLFLQRLRARDPGKAGELERRVRDYRRHLRALEAELNRHKGKTAEQMGQAALEALRRESAAFRRAEQDLRSGIDDLARLVERSGREIEAKAKEVRSRLDGQVTDFRNTDLRRIEGDLRRRIENARRVLEQDLRTLKQSLEK